jgi:hypothetical protein
MRKIAAALALAAVAGAGAVGLAAEANATPANSRGVITIPTTSYTSPSNQTTPVHYGLQPGQAATVVCFTEGQSVYGNHYWYRIGLDGRLGFVHRGAINVGPDIPHC